MCNTSGKAYYYITVLIFYVTACTRTPLIFLGYFESGGTYVTQHTHGKGVTHTIRAFLVFYNPPIV